MKTALWGFLGLLAGGAIALGIGLFWLTYINTYDMGGGKAMAVTFFFTPLGAVTGAIIGLVVARLGRE